MSVHAIVLAAALLLQGPKLEIKDTAVGSGRAAQAKDVVTLEYTGKLADGKEFDSSKGKQPFAFVLGSGQVIPGWDQGIVGMKVGGKRHLVIPPELAYGDQPPPGSEIPAKATLIFDVELLRIDRPSDPQKIEMKTTAEGKGTGAVIGDEILLNWHGTYVNGVDFGDTYKSKQPAKFLVGSIRTPPGLNQALIGIKVGEKRHALIPFGLGYGERGAAGIPPYATLIFDFEPISITTKAQALERDQKMIKIEEQTVGAGKEAKDGNTVEIHYTGTFPDGKKFDSSRDRNQTFSFKLGAGQVIRGFDLGVMGMKEGGKRKVTIPPELAYGARGAGSAIPPNSTLVFELELVSVK